MIKSNALAFVFSNGFECLVLGATFQFDLIIKHVLLLSVLLVVDTFKFF